MAQIGRHSSIAVFALMVFFTQGANASIVWELNDFMFDDGTSATGSFVWDETYNYVSSWDIVTTDGSRPGTTYSSTTGSYNRASSAGIFYFQEGSNQFRIVIDILYLLDTPSASLALPTGTRHNGFLECTNCSSIRYGEPGAFLSAVPIPPAVWLFGSGLIGLIGVARRKTNA